MEGYDYAKCIEISKRVRWDIDKDVIRGREFGRTVNASIVSAFINMKWNQATITQNSQEYKHP